MMVIAADEGSDASDTGTSGYSFIAGNSKKRSGDYQGRSGMEAGTERRNSDVRGGTFLEKAAVVVTSAVDGRGIEDLRRILWQMCLEETQGGDYAQRNASVNSFRLQLTVCSP